MVFSTSPSLPMVSPATQGGNWKSGGVCTASGPFAGKFAGQMPANDARCGSGMPVQDDARGAA